MPKGNKFKVVLLLASTARAAGGGSSVLGSTERLDHLDCQILMHLQRDGRSSYTALAALYGVSEGTVRKRDAAVGELGVVEDRGVTNPAKTGMDTVAVIWLRVEQGRLSEGGFPNKMPCLSPTMWHTPLRALQVLCNYESLSESQEETG